MSRMVRKQVYIEPEQAELLKQRANELGMSEADLIRRCIDQLAQGQTPDLIKLKSLARRNCRHP
jgi:hypothetical protein